MPDIEDEGLEPDEPEDDDEFPMLLSGVSGGIDPSSVSPGMYAPGTSGTVGLPSPNGVTGGMSSSSGVLSTADTTGGMDNYNSAYKNLMQHYGSMPSREDFAPDWKHKLLAGAMGAIVGWGGGNTTSPPNPAAGFDRAQSMLQAPYAKAMQRWQMEEQPLEKQVQLETGRLNAGAMNTYRQQMAQARMTTAQSTVDRNAAYAQRIKDLSDPVKQAEIATAKHIAPENTPPGTWKLKDGADPNDPASYFRLGVSPTEQTEKDRQANFAPNQALIQGNQQKNIQLRESLRHSNALSEINAKLQAAGQKPLSEADELKIDTEAKKNIASAGIYNQLLPKSNIKGHTNDVDWNQQLSPQLHDILNTEKARLAGRQQKKISSSGTGIYQDITPEE
jgi:hypothetical protein